MSRDGLGFEPDVLRAKYARERQRRLRSDGISTDHYRCTGEDMNRLADERVGIIGTGATAVQCVPMLARSAQHLFVFDSGTPVIGRCAGQPADRSAVVGNPRRGRSSSANMAATRARRTPPSYRIR